MYKYLATKKRKPGTIIQTETMKEMDLTIEILDPSLVKEPSAKADRTVALTMYSSSNADEKILTGHGGDAQLHPQGFFKGNAFLMHTESGVFHEAFRKGSATSFPIFYWIATEPLDEEVGLLFDLSRKKPR